MLKLVYTSLITDNFNLFLYLRHFTSLKLYQLIYQKL